MSSVRKSSSGKPASCITCSIERAHCGTFEACFRSPPFPAMKCGRDEAEHLPVGEVPGHHREDDAERIEADVAPPRVARLLARREVPLGALGVVLADPGALRHLGGAVLERLAHLERHELRVLGRALAEQLRRLAHRRARARRTSVRAQAFWAAAAAVRIRSTSAGSISGKVDDALAGGGVEGLDGHGILRCGKRRDDQPCGSSTWRTAAPVASASNASLIFSSGIAALWSRSTGIRPAFQRDI